MPNDMENWKFQTLGWGKEGDYKELGEKLKDR